jgi:hypothetical protein
MSTIRSDRTRALLNLGKAVDVRRRFPRNVFLGQWRDFLFFDSDWIFDAAFVEQVKLLLAIEGGTCVCLANLEGDPQLYQDEQPLFIEQSTTQGVYRSFLGGSDPINGWMYNVGRFGCTSDVGQWCIYCERRSEIAVIGFLSSAPTEPYMPLVAQLKAARIADAIEGRLSYGFSPEALSEQWRGMLLQEYGTRSS